MTTHLTGVDLLPQTVFHSCSTEGPQLRLVVATGLGAMPALPRTVLDPRDFGFPNTRRRFYLLAKRSDHGHGGHGCPDGPPAVPPQRVEYFLKARPEWQVGNLIVDEIWVNTC